MAEQENSTGRYAKAVAIGETIKSDGSSHLDYAVEASDSEMVDNIKIEITDCEKRWGFQPGAFIMGSPPENSNSLGETRYFGMPARWNSPWEPQGPKPNWSTKENNSE